MKNNIKKPIFVLLAVFTLLSALFISVYADTESTVPVYFKYRDGVVRDGSLGDRPGIIGDEDEFDRDSTVTSNLIGGNNNNIADNVLPSDARKIPVSTVGASASDEAAVNTVFWGIIATLLIGSAIILLVVLMTPKKQKRTK